MTWSLYIKEKFIFYTENNIPDEMEEEIFEALYNYIQYDSTFPFTNVKITNYEDHSLSSRAIVHRYAWGEYYNNKNNKLLFEFKISDGNIDGSKFIYVDDLQE